MDIALVPRGSLRCQLLRRSPLLHFPAPFLGHGHGLPTTQTKSLTLTPNLILATSGRPLSAFTCNSLSDDFLVGALMEKSPDHVPGPATAAVEVNPEIAVKKKATELSPHLKGTSIFLVGMNSPMKTSVGKLLADALRYYFFDSDDLVEEAAGGKSDGKSFRERDKAAFSESETEVLKQLSSMGRLVVCAGNGTVQDKTNLSLLRYGLSIWVDVPLAMVTKDVLGNEAELSEPEVFDKLSLLYEDMRGGYGTADAVISLQKVASKLGHDDFDAVTKEDMVLEVLKEIEKLMRVKKMMEEAARPF